MRQHCQDSGPDESYGIVSNFLRKNTVWKCDMYLLYDNVEVVIDFADIAVRLASQISDKSPIEFSGQNQNIPGSSPDLLQLLLSAADLELSTHSMYKVLSMV